MTEGTTAIRWLKARNYGCLKDIEVEFTPLNALIGPNDSGKSTILRAVRTLSQLGCSSFADVTETQATPFFPGLDFTIDFDLRWLIEDNYGYRIESGYELGVVNEYLHLNSGETPANKRHLSHVGLLTRTREQQERGDLLKKMSSRFIHFNPDALRRGTGLITRDREIQLNDEQGQGLPSVYDAVLKRDRQAYTSIEEKVQKLFPTVKGLNLFNDSPSTTALMLNLVTGKDIDARFVSEGLLFYLAFAAIPHLEPTSVLLVEEPENGLHPAMMRHVVGILRDISKHTQVIVATHSPLIVNELRPEEVSVVTRTAEEGTRVRPIKDTPNFIERSKVYALGELWVSYADGEMEEPLFAEELEPEDTGEPVNWGDDDEETEA